MHLSFWGVRGSLPAPKRTTWRYGGNTSCVEVRAGGQLLILDAGSGMQDLGHELRARSNGAHLTAHLLFTHYHWDHIQGLPFFEPIYVAGNTLHILGPRPDGDVSLASLLDELFRPPFFPIPANELKSTYDFKETECDGSFALGKVRVRTCRLNHPQGALAYRLDYGGASIVYATDHEPGDPACDRALGELAHGADMLISDAQYLPEEWPQKTGWGHGSWEHSVALAREAGVKNLFLFHHDPWRTDQEIDRMVLLARQIFPNTWAAAEAMLLEITAKQFHVGLRDAPLSTRTRLPSLRQSQTEEVAAERDAAWGESLGLAGTYRQTEANASVSEPPPDGQGALAATLEKATPSGDNGGSQASVLEVAHRKLFERGSSAGATGVELRLRSEQSAAGQPPMQAVRPAPKPSAANPKAAADDSPPSQQRRYDRISLAGRNAYGVIRNGFDPKMVRVVDLSFGGVGFLVDDGTQLPESFYARLHVPFMPVAEVKIRRVHVQPVQQGKLHIGCRFSS